MSCLMVCDGEVQCESRYLLKNESGCSNEVNNDCDQFGVMQLGNGVAFCRGIECDQLVSFTQ